MQRDVGRPYHGVRAFGPTAETVLEHCRRLQPMLRPGYFFSHTTALILHGAPELLDGDEPHISVEFPRTPPRGRGIRGHSLSRTDPVDQDGLPVSSPAFAWSESASLLTVEQLIAAGDALVTGPRINGVRAPSATALSDLAAALTIRGRSPGSRRARAALPHIRRGVDSPMETATRRMIVRAGLPEPDTDVELRVGSGLLLHADLGYPELRIAIEYEGDEHRASRPRWLRDVERHEAMREAGWSVLRVTALTLRDPGGLIARIRALRASSGWV